MLTTDYLQQHLGTPVDADDLAVLTLLEAGVVAMVEDVTGRTFPDEGGDVVEVLDGNGEASLELSMPIETDATEADVTVEFISTATTWTAANASPPFFRIDVNRGFGQRRNVLTLGPGRKWPLSEVRVSYPVDFGDAGLAEIRALVADLTCNRFVQRTRATLAGAAEAQPDGIPQQYQAVLDRWTLPYRVMQPVLRRA